MRRQGPGDGDALLLAAGELVRIAVACGRVDANGRQHVGDALFVGAGDVEAGARRFVEDLALGPSMWDLLPKGLRSTMVANAPSFLEMLDDPDWGVLDARSEDRFMGENETLDPVAGHIPGALNRFFKTNLEASGCFKSPDTLRQEIATVLGERDPRAIVHQCGSGVTACHNLLAMEHAGLTGSKLYPGSWSEWVSDPSRPVSR